MVAEKKRGGNSSPAFLKKLNAACSGVALAVVSCLSVYDPIPVHADFGNFGDTVDYITSASGSDAEHLVDSPVAGWFLLLYALRQFATDYDQMSVDMNASQYAEMTGLYYDANGEKKVISLLFYDNVSNPSFNTGLDRIFVYCDDFGLYATIAPGNYINVTYNSNAGYILVSGGYQQTCTISSTSQTFLAGSLSSQYPYYCKNFRSYIPNLANTALSSRFSTNFNFNGDAIMGDVDSTTPVPLPSGTINFADLDSYVQGPFREYVTQYYPDYIYLLPDPEPEPPQYATDDIVPGIPKEWTIINPELPTSPHLDLTIPDGEFQDIDPGETFTGFSSGVGFWWAMVNEILNTFHIKTLALALLAVAVAIFALYKIGG